ncbi:glucans biosynthesis glucosyltransferase MdoH [Paracoccus pacificus]|uniref:Glucans biosynthesis glucosyltransferase H n=1 Tax=Paracoccus pacificus TaxID=1463598 RepID=A0ABW4R7H1_9RHOB
MTVPASAAAAPPEAAVAPPETLPPMQPAVPPESRLEMPVQDFSKPPPPGPARQRPTMNTVLARLVAFGGAALIAIIGAWQMTLVFGEQITPLQMVLLVLFTLTFSWVGFSFTSILASYFAPKFDTPEGPNAARIVVVMPVYHENAGETSGLLAALAQDIEAVGLADRTEIFILSDSRLPDAWMQETAAVANLRAVSPIPVWYRRRTDNKGRKAGNVADFVRRWGGRYDQMVVLDADSVLTGDVIRIMSARMNADPALGLIQTVPMLVDGQTIFARLQQFAGRIYGPPIARGVSAWSGDNGNFWGHNAMIRVRAFAACCGLPVLPGGPPFGGAVMSHDFVEAALLCRAGWKVRLDHDLRDSFEGSPPTLLDMAARERRWAQGNLQHLRVIGAKGFTWVSRAHFVIGILGFVMSPLWLAMIITGLCLSAVVLLSRPDYFPSTYQLFPTWPTFDPVRMVWLFIAAMSFLLLPKIIAVAVGVTRPLRHDAGGARRMAASATFEVLLSSLIAPVQMLNQTRQILDILRGEDSGWEAQVRAGTMPPWGMVLRRHALHVIVGLLTALGLAWFAPAQLAWLSPILAGLILSPAISRWSASPVFGRWARRRGLLLTPAERRPPPILTAAHALAFNLGEDIGFARLHEDPAARARHVALLPPRIKRPAAQRLDEISAEAKIKAAGNSAEAMSFLSLAERMAVLANPELLESWAKLSR